MSKKKKERMTAAELAKYIDKDGYWTVNPSVKVPVKTIDARESFGRLDLKITPQGGSGECWVDSKYVEI